MRIVYLDEAGTSAVDGNFVVVGGVIIHGDHQLSKVRGALWEIYERHIPEADRDSLVLHAYEIHNGNRYFDKVRKPEWTAPKRMAILADLAKLIAEQNLWVTAGILTKEEYTPEVLEAHTDKDYLRKCVGLAYTACLLEVDQWFKIKAKAENCFVIVEDNKDTRQFVKEMHRQHQSKEYAQLLGAPEQTVFPFKHIHEDPNFQEKRVAHPLILADFVAFIWKRLLAGDRSLGPLYLPWKDRSAHWPAQLPSRSRR